MSRPLFSDMHYDPWRAFRLEVCGLNQKCSSGDQGSILTAGHGNVKRTRPVGGGLVWRSPSHSWLCRIASLKELHREERAIINVTQVSEYTGADLAEGNPEGDGCEAPSRHTRLRRIVCHVRTTGITTPRCRNSGPKRCSNPKSRSSNGKTALRSLVPS